MWLVAVPSKQLWKVQIVKTTFRYVDDYLILGGTNIEDKENRLWKASKNGAQDWALLKNNLLKSP